jgi:hypothetical protein
MATSLALSKFFFSLFGSIEAYLTRWGMEQIPTTEKTRSSLLMLVLRWARPLFFSCQILAQCYDTVQYSTVQYSTVQYSTAQYSTEDHTYFVIEMAPPPPPTPVSKHIYNATSLPLIFFRDTVLGYTLLTCLFMFFIIGLVEHTENR